MVNKVPGGLAGLEKAGRVLGRPQNVTACRMLSSKQTTPGLLYYSEAGLVFIANDPVFRLDSPFVVDLETWCIRWHDIPKIRTGGGTFGLTKCFLELGTGHAFFAKGGAAGGFFQHVVTMAQFPATRTP